MKSAVPCWASRRWPPRSSRLPRVASAQGAYKAEYKMSTGACRRRSPGARAARSSATWCSERTAGPHQHQAVPRRLAGAGRAGPRVLGDAPGRDRHAVRRADQLDRHGAAARRLHAAVPDARPQGLGRGDGERGGHEGLLRAWCARPAPSRSRWARPATAQISNSKRPITKPDDLKGIKIRVVGSPMYGEIMSCDGRQSRPS